MSKLKFIEIVGNASTSASLDGKSLGHAVNACAYDNGNGVTLKLESNNMTIYAINPHSGTRVAINEISEDTFSLMTKRMTDIEKYETECSNPMQAAAIIAQEFGEERLGELVLS